MCQNFVSVNIGMYRLSYRIGSNQVVILFQFPFYFDISSCYKDEPGSSVGIATNYGLDGPGSNPGEDEIFRPSRPALGPTQPPLNWVPGLSRG